MCNRETDSGIGAWPDPDDRAGEPSGSPRRHPQDRSRGAGFRAATAGSGEIPWRCCRQSRTGRAGRSENLPIGTTFAPSRARVNGGTNGLEDRKRYLKRAREYGHLNGWINRGRFCALGTAGIG